MTDDASPGYLTFARAHGLASRLRPDRLAAIIVGKTTPNALAHLIAWGFTEGYGEGYTAGYAAHAQEEADAGHVERPARL